MTSVGRVATWIAAAVLAVNALLLGAAGVVAGRPALLVGSAVALGAAILVLLAWRRYQRTLAGITRERQALREETLDLRELLRRNRR